MGCVVFNLLIVVVKFGQILTFFIDIIWDILVKAGEFFMLTHFNEFGHFY